MSFTLRVIALDGTVSRIKAKRSGGKDRGSERTPVDLENRRKGK